MEKPYRLAVWGVGKLGVALIREIQRLPGLELAGGLVFDPAKHAVDLGDLAGIGPIGIGATTSKEELLSLDVDAVLFTTRDSAAYESEADTLALLRAGKNVVSALAYRQVLLGRGQAAFDRLQAAALTGGSTFFATGVDYFINEHLLGAVLAGSVDVRHVYLKEIFRNDALGPEFLDFLGFGSDPADDRVTKTLEPMWQTYWHPGMRAIAQHLGKPIDRFEVANTSVPTPNDIELPGITIRAGTIGRIGFRYDGFCGDELVMTTEGAYHLNDEMRADDAVADDCWIIRVEGHPSLELAISAWASAGDHTDRYDDDPDTTPGYSLTASAILQAVPVVVGAAPGLWEPPSSPLRWRADLFERSATPDPGAVKS